MITEIWPSNILNQPELFFIYHQNEEGKPFEMDLPSLKIQITT